MQLKLRSSSFARKLLYVLYHKPLVINSLSGTCQNQGPQQELEHVTFFSSPWNLFQPVFSSLF